MSSTNQKLKEKSSPRGKQAQLAIVADDLTGACDAAVAFADICSPIRVGVNELPVELTDVLVVSSNSRDVGPLASRRRLIAFLEQIPLEIELFKKVDSVFRGNTFDEISLVLEKTSYDLAVIAPAHPGLGRRMMGGNLFVRELGGERTIDIAKELAARGCLAHRIERALSAEALSNRMKSAVRAEDRVVLCDAIEMNDLCATTRAARSLCMRILWIGSGGLAQALACEYCKIPAATWPTRKGNVIFFIGSNHPATKAQILHIQRVCDLKMDDPAQKEDRKHRIFSVPYGSDEVWLRSLMNGVMPHEIGCLFMTGGETASRVCRALGITSLLIVREFESGVPIAIAEGGAFDGVPVVLKSGAFGRRSLLRDVLLEFEIEKEVTV